MKVHSIWVTLYTDLLLPGSNCTQVHFIWVTLYTSLLHLDYIEWRQVLDVRVGVRVEWVPRLCMSWSCQLQCWSCWSCQPKDNTNTALSQETCCHKLYAGLVHLGSIECSSTLSELHCSLLYLGYIVCRSSSSGFHCMEVYFIWVTLYAGLVHLGSIVWRSTLSGLHCMQV